jgi:hypothetical protein
LWLSFEPSEQEVGNKPLEVLLDFEIDSNNLINVSASLANQPEVRVSRTLSRGKVDEKLFLDLERSIARVNEAKPGFYAVLDFLHRSVAIATTINRVIDPETGQENVKAERESLPPNPGRQSRPQAVASRARRGTRGDRPALWDRNGPPSALYCGPPDPPLR